MAYQGKDLKWERAEIGGRQGTEVRVPGAKSFFEAERKARKMSGS
jgi:hypothetical protein